MATDIRDVEISHITRYMFAVPFIKPGDVVLDACCGVGYGIWLLHNFTHAELVEGFDQSHDAINLAEFHFTSNAMCSSFEDMDFDKQYDVITCFEAIEHVENPELLIKVLSDVLKPGGRLIISTPNEKIMPWNETDFPEHRRHFTFAEIQEMLSDNNIAFECVYNQQSKFISSINMGQVGKFMIIVGKKQ